MKRLILLVFLACVSYTVSAEQTDLSWGAPTHRVNGVAIKEGELARFQLQYAFVPIDEEQIPIIVETFDIDPDKTSFISEDIEIPFGFKGAMWRIKAIDSDALPSAWADSAEWSDYVEHLPYSPIQKMILNINSGGGSITINIGS